MEPIKFKQANITFAENQEQYLPLPAYRDPNDPAGRVISCWGFSWWERFKILFTGKMFLTSLTFHQSLQPLLPEVDSPFIEAENQAAGRPDNPPAPPKKAVG